MIRRCVIAVILSSISFYCSTPPSMHSPGQLQPQLSVIVEDVFKRKPFRGSGSLLLVAGGGKQSGSFDVRYKSAASFDATFYSPLGTIFGSVAVRGDSGVVTFSDTTLRLSLDQPLDASLLPWCDSIAFSAVIAAMCGIPTDMFDPELLVEKAGTFHGCREFVTKNKSTMFTVVLNRDLKKLKRIVISGGTDAPAIANYMVRYENFLHGMARFITIKTSDRNYFSLRYEKITWVQ